MTNAEVWFNIALRPRKPKGSLGRTAQDVHLDSHTAPELCKAVYFGHTIRSKKGGREGHREGGRERESERQREVRGGGGGEGREGDYINYMHVPILCTPSGMWVRPNRLPCFI